MGCGEAGSTSSSAGPGSAHWGKTVVEHQGSLLTDERAAGARGAPESREQERPEHGTPPRGSTGAGAVPCVLENVSNSSSESTIRLDQSRSDTTRWLHAAPTGDGVKPAQNESANSAPGSKCRIR